jgi:hypothetical protein
MKSAKMLTILVMALVFVVCTTEVSEAAAMGTAFTYQGRLMDANNVANGLYDFEFELYDAPSDGNQLGSTIDINDLDVIDGYFTVELDFNDPNAFNGEARWLDIGVRPGNSNDPNAFVTLSPRQEVTPVPYALQTRGIFVDNAGNVGVGTTSPEGKLAVHDNNGDLSKATIIIDNSNVIGHDILDFRFLGATQARIRKANGGGLFFGTEDVQPVNFYVHGGTEMIIQNDGSVGIGTTNPSSKLTVQDGSILVKNTLADTSFAEIRLQKTSIFGADWEMFTGSDTGGVYRTSLVFWNVDPKMVIRNNGNVGIGTASPTYKLDISSGAEAFRVGQANSWFKVRTSTKTVLSLADGEGNRAGFISGGENAAGENVLEITGCDDGGSCPHYTVFHENGNVGIGTSSPAYELDVDGEIQCVTLHETSDARLKTNVRQLTDVLDKIEKIRGVSFEWNEAAESVGAAAGDKYIGVIAQDVEKVFPELVSAPDNNYKSVDYTKLTAVLIEAIKELKSENEVLKKQLKAEDQLLKQRLDALEKIMRQQQLSAAKYDR